MDFPVICAVVTFFLNRLIVEHYLLRTFEDVA